MRLIGERLARLPDAAERAWRRNPHPWSQVPLQRIVSTCLSGLTGRIRATLVREERILADPKLAEAGGQVDEPLGACWEEMLKAGPYDFGDKVVYSFRRVSVTWASLTSPWSSSSTASLPSTK